MIQNTSDDAPLIDRYLPVWDVRERHTIDAHTSAENAYLAIQSADLARSHIVRILLALRGLPAAIMGRRKEGGRRTQPVTLASFENAGFRLLEERPPHELIIGLEGRFWLPDGCLRTPSANEFLTSAPAPGTARAVWDFRVSAKNGSEVSITTETRVLCADSHARRRFLPYWALVRPGSGIIRRAMLRAIRDEAVAE